MAYRKNFISSTIDQINVGSSAAEDKNNGGSASITARNNFFGRFNYDYSSKYLVELLFRYDGSQNFPSGKKIWLLSCWVYWLAYFRRTAF